MLTCHESKPRPFDEEKWYSMNETIKTKSEHITYYQKRLFALGGSIRF